MAVLSKTSGRRVRSWREAFSAMATWRDSGWRSAPCSAGSPGRRRRAVHMRNFKWEASLAPIPLSPVEEGERVMRICNACRYCEGFCAVFPAMERRLTFSDQDLHFLANLCHDCRECLYSCQYAPPHPFGLNLPQTLAAIRRDTYRKYTWPQWLKPLFHKSALSLLASVVVAPLLF